MRVTHSMQFNMALANIQKQNLRLFEAQEEAISGKKVRRPSDDVTNTRRILSSRGTLASIEQFKRNRGTLNTFLQATDISLQSAGNLLIRAKELTVQALNDTLNGSDRDILAKEVAQLFAQAIQLGNDNIDGRYIFAGRRTKQEPFAALITTESTSSGLTASGTLPTLSAGDLIINGTSIRATLVGDDTLSTSDNAASAVALATVINEAAPITGVQAEASTSLALTASSFGNLSAGQFTINGQDVTGTITDAASLVTAVNAATIPGVLAYSSGPTNLTLAAADGRNLRLQTSGSVAAMNFSEFDLSGAALDQTSSGNVSLFSDSAFTIAGTAPAQAGLSAGAIERAVGGIFLGDNGLINLSMSAKQTIAANTIGSEFLVADVRPNIDANTPLSSLHQGQGISPGSLMITDRVGGTASIDLSTAITVSDVLTTISGATGINVTAMLNTSGNGITIVDNNASATRNLTIQEVGSGTTASDLGIVGDRPGNIVGIPLEPLLIPSTLLTLLHEGQGVNPGTIHIANGPTEADVDLSSAQTVADVLALINGSVTNVTASINVTGTALEVRSNDPTTVAIVTDVNSGKAASDLGIQGPRDILKTLGLLQEALQRNDTQAIDHLLIHIDAGIDQIGQLRADVGARLNRIELVENNQVDLEITVTTLLSQSEDTDAVEAFSRLVNASTALEAALAASARTLQLSLFDFFR